MQTRGKNISALTKTKRDPSDEHENKNEKFLEKRKHPFRNFAELYQEQEKEKEEKTAHLQKTTILWIWD